MNAPFTMPQYRCHKTVRAAKITDFRHNGNFTAPDLVLGEIGAVVSMLAEWHNKHQPHRGGYFVQYEDGYQSFSPAEAFEDGYALLPTPAQDFRDRVIAEKNELGERLEKLRAFIGTEKFAALPSDEKERLQAQSEHMGMYLSILVARIAAFAA